AQHEDDEQAEVGEVLQVGREQTRQASVSVAPVVAQDAADLLDRQPLVGQLGRLDRFAGANWTLRAVLVAVAVEQALMAQLLVAAAITVQLREQRRVLGRDLIGGPRLAAK